MTHHSERRRLLLQSCGSLHSLLKSLNQPGLTAFLNQLGRIESAARDGDESKIRFAVDDFGVLFQQLKDVDAGDGDKIICHKRIEKFFDNIWPD